MITLREVIEQMQPEAIEAADKARLKLWEKQEAAQAKAKFNRGRGNVGPWMVDENGNPWRQVGDI